MTDTTKSAATEELPPFSFSKKPIKSSLPASTIPAELNRAFSDLPKPPDSPNCNDRNYDDQIRAPRMSSATHYTYKPEPPRPFTGRTESTNSHMSVDSGSSHAGGNNNEAFNPVREDHMGISLRANPEASAHHLVEDQSTSDYQPATVDLNQPTRRNSEPLKKSWGVSVSVGNILSLDTSDSPQDSSNYSSDGMISSRQNTPSMQSKLMRAVENLDANITSEERDANADSASTQASATHGGRIRHYVGEGPTIQQVYTQKRPVCLPAVLRPPQDIDTINEEDFYNSSPEENTFSRARLSEFPFQVPKDVTPHEISKTEPTHEHWRPNNFSDHCMNCFEGFRSFLSPQRRGRHHCRFCGLLYCHNCLYKARETPSFEIAASTPAESAASARTNSASSNSSSVISSISATSSNVTDEGINGVMLDSKARIVIPLYKNLADRGMGIAALQDKFKFCKVCKTCGNNSSQLLYILNQRSRTKKDIDSPYVFIDNPYLAGTHTAQPHPAYDLNSLPSKTGSKLEHTAERRSSHNQVPSDWTWSSF